MAVRTTDTIPKLDDVNYLFDSLACVRDGFTFDAIRLELIRLRSESGAVPENVPSHKFWSNARDVLRELMRLGLLRRATLPSRPAQLDAHRAREFELTDEGKRFLALEERSRWEFRHRFAQAMLIAHPYMRELHRILDASELFFPRLQRTELPGSTEDWRTGPPEPLGQVCAWVSGSVQDVLGVSISPEQLEGKVRPYVIHAWKRLDIEQKSHMFSQAVVKAMNDVFVRALLEAYGLRMDFVTFRSAVGLLSNLGAIWHTRSLLDRRGWTVWSTSVTPPALMASGGSPAALALEGPVWFQPRVVKAEVVRDHLIETFFSRSDRRGGFALIHVLRAEVCHRLHIHGRDFDAVLSQMHTKKLSHEAYEINLDRGGSDEVPPSETPFRIGDKAFYLITLLKR